LQEDMGKELLKNKKRKKGRKEDGADDL